MIPICIPCGFRYWFSYRPHGLEDFPGKFRGKVLAEGSKWISVTRTERFQFLSVFTFHSKAKQQLVRISPSLLQDIHHKKISSNPINPSLLLSIFTNVVIADFHFAHIFYTKKPDSHRTELNSWISFFLTREWMFFFMDLASFLWNFIVNLYFLLFAHAAISS